MRNFANANGSLTASSTGVTVDTADCATACVQLTGTWVGTITFQGTVDNSNWVSLNGVAPTTGTPATTATSNGVYVVDVAGLQFMRAQCTAFTSGTIVVTILATEASGTSIAIDTLSVSSAVTSVIPGTAATNLGKAEDAAHTSGDVGVMALGVRNNTASALAGTDGDYIPLTTDTNGALWTSLATKLDSTNDSITAVVASGGIAAGAIAAGATSIADNEDAASADADRGVKILVTQKATPANTAGTDGDYEFLQQSGGKLWVGADLKQVAGTTIVNGGVAGSQSIGGTVATNVAITANPVNLGAQAVSSENTAVTTARQVQLVADLVGKLIVLPYANPENFVSGAITTAMTGTTSTSLIAAPAAGLRNYITQITVSNAHATVGTDIIIQDGSGGTTLYTIPAAAVYGGAVVTFPTPLRQPTTATAIFCANVTTGASTKVSASGYKGA